MNLKILGVMGKADLEPGLKLGMYVSEPVGAENVPLTISESGTVTSDNEVKWAFDQSQSSRFFVYAPYDESYKGQEYVTINTPTDQRSKEWLLQGNLMTCIASGGPKESSVVMKMKHSMTAMVISFDNRTGEQIDAVSVAGFMTEGKLDLLTGSLTATGEMKAILPMRSPMDDNTFIFLYIPQNSTPVFTVTLSSGKTIAITFDNYCHEYPGSVVNMDIQLDENTPKANILKLSGANISQWTTNGIPSLSPVYDYVNLSGLKDIEIDEEDGFFAAYINKVVVTAVDRTSEDFFGVILEDSTRAIHAWTYFDSPLKVGSTIVGPVLGYMDKLSDEEFHIAYLYTSYATVSKTGTLPCTEGTFKELATQIDKWEYRRMLFKDVTLVSGFENDRAVFKQDTNVVSVVCPGIDIRLADGASGDIIGFPVRMGSEITVMVYDVTVFNAFSKEPVESVLTKASTYGLYDISSPDTAVYLMKGNDMELQHSIRRYSFGRTMQVADTRNGEVHLFLIEDCIGAPIPGHEYEVYFNTFGVSDLNGVEMTMECVKRDDNSAWLIDTKGKYGLILAL